MANVLSILAWRSPLPDREAWQSRVYRVAKSWTLLKGPCAHRCKTFLPVAALPQGELSMNVERLLGLWGFWQCQVCGDVGCLYHRSYDPISVFFQASCSWRSGLFGQSFSVAPAIQALRVLPCLGSFSSLVHQSLKEAPLVGSHSVVQWSGHGWASLSIFQLPRLTCGGREAMVMTLLPVHDSAVSPCFHGCPAFLHRHFPP